MPGHTTRLDIAIGDSKLSLGSPVRVQSSVCSCVRSSAFPCRAQETLHQTRDAVQVHTKASRCFQEWRRLADERWWKQQLRVRDREIEVLKQRCRGLRNQPIVVLQKRRLSKNMHVRHKQADQLGSKRVGRAIGPLIHRQLGAAVGSWTGLIAVRSSVTRDSSQISGLPHAQLPEELLGVISVCVAIIEKRG